MIWPLSLLFKSHELRVHHAEVAAAEARTDLYQKLFAIDDAFGLMVKRSIILLGDKNEPPDHRT